MEGVKRILMGSRVGLGLGLVGMIMSGLIGHCTGEWKGLGRKMGGRLGMVQMAAGRVVIGVLDIFIEGNIVWTIRSGCCRPFTRKMERGRRWMIGMVE